ncbi:hypothetical protein DRJ17_07590, partial [Candidatus Woesearchaeota archaeon]
GYRGNDNHLRVHPGPRAGSFLGGLGGSRRRFRAAASRFSGAGFGGSAGAPFSVFESKFSGKELC